MQKIINVLFIAATLTLASCGNKGGDNSLAGKKAELEKLKKEQAANDDKIKALEKEIAKLDTSAVKEDVAKLVGTEPVALQNFSHYIDLQGRVEAEDISYISPRLGGGQVRAVYVKRGDYVKKGQLLLKLDDAIVKQQVAASKQSTETIKTQLTLAKDVYNRRNNLWKQGIGTEIELITARTNVESLEKQLAAANENIKVQQEQQSGANVYSDVDGIADEVNVRVGEMFTGFSGNLPQIKIVNTSNLKVVTDIPENYSGKVRQGSTLIVNLPDVNKTFNSTVNISGKVIDPNSRSFRVEGKLPKDAAIRPNQIAQVKILDYNAPSAIAVPVNTVATDEKGKYVYVAVNEGGKMVARKKQIVVGELYGDKIEVKSGLAAGDQLINDGYQNIYDGQLLKTDNKK
ncbi:efflux RND transporter periplasmic adaptor subunit [Sediminibacterium roseum]|uniref:Efflux RND transporter periplasmic adaptor subunit n=1 Tax=Sediminibacterium roseum TaxID=1978412 RepID=A0ABX0A0R3_9BACT|nr:efflux RND transporter periplasmic adaptor subunit [Sediminibacterium roseum]NCI51883.1 efflux RND transporter periplasmic adaptor subunit [Sediminibacterium roseum]